MEKAESRCHKKKIRKANVFLKTNAVYTYEIAILIGFAHIVPANFRCTSCTCTFIEL